MRKTCLKLILSLILISFTQSAVAQFFSVGIDPIDVKWKIIKTEHYNIIFPYEIDSLARKYATVLENNRKRVLESLVVNPKRISVVLHPYCTKSNGTVGWAPARMDFFTTPPPFRGTADDWGTHLALHETRHVGQFAKWEQGAFKVLKYIFGEQISAIGSGLFVPGWFMEGDAVVSETQFSKAGRGREAEFLAYFRMAFINDDFRNWDKWHLGSTEKKTPDHYSFGYLINSTARFLTDDYFMEGKYLDYSVRGFYKPKVIFGAYNKGFQASPQQVLKEATEVMGNIWKNDYNSRAPFTPYREVCTQHEKRYCEYFYPIRISLPGSKYDKSYIVAKWGYDEYRKLVIVDTTGKESILFPFSYYSSPLVIHKEKVYWSETTSHNTQNLEDYSELCLLDLNTGKRKIVTNRTRYYNPTISSTGDTIAVADYPVEGSSFLVMLNASDYSEMSRVEAPRRGQIKESTFIGNKLYCTVVTQRGLCLYCLENGKWRRIIKEQQQSIKGFRSFEKRLYFSSDLDGVQNIYCYDTENHILRRLTNSEYGALYPFYDPVDNELLYSWLYKGGYHIAGTKRDSLDWSLASFEKPYLNPIAEHLTAQVNHQSIAIRDTNMVNVADTALFPSKHYNKLTNLFKFHSWAPFYYNFDRLKSLSFEHYYDLASIGATFYSQNDLSTATTMLGYSYHNGFHSGHVKFSYAGVDPNFEISADINDRNVNEYKLEDIGSDVYVNTVNEKGGIPYVTTELLAYWPFDFNSGGWYRVLYPYASWTFDNDRYFSFSKNKFVLKNQLNFGLSYGQVLPTSRSAIFPRWGFGLSARGGTAAGMGDCFGSLFYTSAFCYLPGITKVQGLKLAFSFQQQLINKKSYYLTPIASLPRGYRKDYPSSTFVKGSVDYAIPIYLGDFSISSILYFQRLQVIPFIDYARDMNDQSVVKNYYSFGTDLLVDFNVIRVRTLISAGVRYARTGPQTGNQNYFQMLFKINL